MADLKQLWFNGTLDEWNVAVSDYFNNANVRKNQKIENCLLAITPENVRDMSTKEFFDYLHDQYYVWKYSGTWLSKRQRELSSYQTENSMDELGKIQKKLIHDFEYDSADTEGLLCTATRIHGLGVAGASGLLSFLSPQLYGTLDRLVVDSLKLLYPDDEKIRKIKGNDLSINNGVFLENLLRNKADSLNKRLRTDEFSSRKIDMVLWNYGHSIKNVD